MVFRTTIGIRIEHRVAQGEGGVSDQRLGQGLLAFWGRRLTLVYSAGIGCGQHGPVTGRLGRVSAGQFIVIEFVGIPHLV